MTLRNTLSPDEYRVPLTPDGTVEFAPDTNGVERVDFQLSSLERMTREAIGFAEVSQSASPERTDNRRGEYGERIVELVSVVAPEQVLDPTSTKVLLGYTARARAFRQEAIDESSRAA